jgi:hypothetical protein
MSTTKQHPIKALLGLRQVAAEVVLSTSTHIFTEIYNNLDFTPPQAPAPPVDQATLKSANDALASAIGTAVDGGKKAIAQKNAQKEVVVKLLTQLAHYAEANCKDDLTIFISSGFTAKSSIRNLMPPVSESFKKIVPGPDSGQILASLMKYPDAASYEIRWAPVGDGGVPGAWTSQAIGKIIKVPTTISGLKPGTTYAFQARAVKKAGGYSDWGDSVTRIVV